MRGILILNFFGYDQVKEQGHKGHVTPSDFLRLEEIAKDQGLGRWSKVSINYCSPRFRKYSCVISKYFLTCCCVHNVSLICYQFIRNKALRRLQ
jgi:hypothetical protein